MLNRLTVSALLKTVILAMSLCVVIGVSLNAWDSWGRLQVANRISVIADTSAYLFKAMHNLRTDRATTERLLNADAPMDADIEKYLRGLRDGNRRSEPTPLPLSLHELHALWAEAQHHHAHPLRPRGDDHGALRALRRLPPGI